MLGVGMNGVANQLNQLGADKGISWCRWLLLKTTRPWREIFLVVGSNAAFEQIDERTQI
jgi:hypothetical protein